MYNEKQIDQKARMIQEPITTQSFQSLFRIGTRRRPTPRPVITTTGTPTSGSTARSTRRRLPFLTMKTIGSQETPTTTRSSETRVRFPPRRPSTIRTTPKRVSSSTSETIDQYIESSNQQSLEEDFNGVDTTELSDIASALQNIQQAPLPKTKPLRIPPIFPSSTPKVVINIKSHTKPRFRYTTTRPTVLTTTRKTVNRSRKPKTFEKILPPVNQFKSFQDYDYYEDDEGILMRIPEHSKVLIHSNGDIECLDQGSFPHPVSCKKFISCAKMENGKVLGWEYTCPKNLSFDPIGGLCNWSAGLGCNE